MTVDFTHGYQPPGVYVEEQASPLVTGTGLTATLVALVGPSIGYQRGSEQIALSTTITTLSREGIDEDSVEITVIASGVIVDAADYAVTTATGAVKIAREADAEVVEGTPVFVTYRFVPTGFFDPKRFDNYEDVKDAYGEPLNLSPMIPGDTDYKAVTSPLSLAAKIAFENGASDLVMVATDPADPVASGDLRTALSVAMTKIETQYAVNIIVPVTDGIDEDDATGVGVECATHVNLTSRDGFFRTAILGFDPASVTEPDSTLNTGGFRSKRVVMPFASPNGLSYYNGSSNQTLALGHQYLAAALGGRLASLPVQKSLTREVIRSFSGVSGSPLSNALKNQYAAAGILVAEVNRAGSLVVRHGVTTDTSNINTRELSVVRARDALVSLVQYGTESSGLIGQPIDVNTPFTVKGVVSGLLEHAKITGTILDYLDLKVRQRSIDPSVIEVKFSYKPSYPLNYIVVSFAINVATGETEDLLAIAA